MGCPIGQRLLETTIHWRVVSRGKKKFSPEYQTGNKDVGSVNETELFYASTVLPTTICPATPS